MANPTSKLDLVVNGVTTSYDIHDANAIPKSGGAVLSGTEYLRTVNDSALYISGGTTTLNGGMLELYGKDHTLYAGCVSLKAHDSSNISQMAMTPTGAFMFLVNGTTKNVAMQEDVIPRSGGAVITGLELARADNYNQLRLCGGTTLGEGGTVIAYGKNIEIPEIRGGILLQASNGSIAKYMNLYPSGTWTWDGTACQITSDQRLKQQIAEIDDKLLDAWEDVDLVQFKYNDAVDQKGDNARLHTGYVVQQIDNACKKHGVDISQYGLFCHEEYAEETEEVEVEQKDGTKTKETKVIREASEHYSLRYTEALVVECKYLRRCIARLTVRIEELEKGNNTK